MGTTAILTLLTIVFLGAAAVAIIKILKEIFEFLFKVMAGVLGISIVFTFIYFANLSSHSNTRSFESVPFEEPLERINNNDISSFNNNVQEVFETNNLQRVAYSPNKQSNKIIVEHHHYFHKGDERNQSFETKITEDELMEYTLSQEVKAFPQRKHSTIFTSRENSMATNIHRVKPKAKIEESFNCYGKRIPDGFYVLVEGVYSSMENAQQRVLQLKKLGFSKADFFWAPCYESAITRELFVVTLDRHCRTEASINLKKSNSIKKLKRLRMKYDNPRIIQLYDPLFQSRETL